MSIKAEDICKPEPSLASVYAEKEKPARRRPLKEKVVLSWSGGKDSTMAAYQLLASQKYEIAALLTTVTEEYERISMHGVRRELLQRQSESLGIPLHPVMIPKDCSNEIYEARMREAMDHFKARGIGHRGGDRLRNIRGAVGRRLSPCIGAERSGGRQRKRERA